MRIRQATATDGTAGKTTECGGEREGFRGSGARSHRPSKHAVTRGRLLVARPPFGVRLHTHPSSVTQAAPGPIV